MVYSINFGDENGCPMGVDWALLLHVALQCIVVERNEIERMILSCLKLKDM